MNTAVAHDDVARVLADGGSPLGAAEAHGILCGALCARQAWRLEDWLEELGDGDLPAGLSVDEAAVAVLAAAFARTLKELRGGDMDFQPLLPADHEELSVRTEALADWAQGFLYGLGGSAGGAVLPLSPQCSEILADFAEISRAGEVGSEEAELEENAYTELVEFVRVGVQLMHEELADWRASKAADTRSH